MRETLWNLFTALIKTSKTIPSPPVNSDMIRTANHEIRIDTDTFIDLGGWLGVPPVECRERALIVQSVRYSMHLGKRCIARS